MLARLNWGRGFGDFRLQPRRPPHLQKAPAVLHARHSKACRIMSSEAFRHDRHFSRPITTQGVCPVFSVPCVAGTNTKSLYYNATVDCLSRFGNVQVASAWCHQAKKIVEIPSVVASQQDFAILWKILMPRNAAGLVRLLFGVARLDMPMQVASDSTARVSI